MGFLEQEPGEFVGMLFQKEQGVEDCNASGAKVLREIREITGDRVGIFSYDW